MDPIKIEHDPDPSQLDALGVTQWDIWTKEISRFPWTYNEREICFLLDGEVTVTPDGGLPVRIVKGDLVTFPAGLSCTWDIHKPVRKYYRFG